MNRQKKTVKTTSIKQAVKHVHVAENRSSRGKDSPIVFKNVERIGSVMGSVGFGVVLAYDINPGLVATFPWLSTIARQFDKYKVKKLVFRYKNVKGTAASGNITMAADYDVIDAAPTTAGQITQMTDYVDGAPWTQFSLSTKSWAAGPLFVREGPLVGVDMRNHDACKVYVACEGCADTSLHGYVEVEYEIELFAKQGVVSNSIASNRRLSEFSIASSASPGTNIPWLAETNAGNFGNAAGVLTLSAGTYRIVAVMSQYTSLFVNNVSDNKWPSFSNIGIRLITVADGATLRLQAQNSTISSGLLHIELV
nr:MAG: coat protein [Guiyang tombus-like virus 2]